MNTIIILIFVAYLSNKLFELIKQLIDEVANLTYEIRRSKYKQ